MNEKQRNHCRHVLSRHGLSFRSFIIQGEPLFLIVAKKPLVFPEITQVGKWYTEAGMKDLTDNYEDADVIKREERKAENRELRQQLQRSLFYW